jgi:hypothetical protein
VKRVLQLQFQGEKLCIHKLKSVEAEILQEAWQGFVEMAGD